MGRDYKHPRKIEYELLRSDDESGVVIKKAAPFDANTAGAIDRFKSGVIPDKEPLPLKYSGLYEPKAGGGYTCMLGWDHAAHLQREKGIAGRYYVRAIYSHSYQVGVPETMVHKLGSAKGESALLDANPSILRLPKDDHQCGGHKGADCVWRKYTLPAPGEDGSVRLNELITFSVTSCSFACLFDESLDNLFISHMAFSPIIPVAWLAASELKPREQEWMRMIASVNSTDEELTKITTQARFPWADRLAIDSVLLLRGREGLNVFMTHPYLGLDLTPGNVKYRGALGYNNDPTRGFRELPPFHSILADTYPIFMKGEKAADILEATAKLLRGELGYADLHAEAINQIALADYGKYKTDGDTWYTSDRLTSLLKQLDKPWFGDALVVPKELERWERGARSAFLLAELAVNPDAPGVKWLKETVLDAWDRIQRSFSLELKHHAKWAAPSAQEPELEAQDQVLDKAGIRIVVTPPEGV